MTTQKKVVSSKTKGPRKPPLTNEQVVEMVKDWDKLSLSGWADHFGVSKITIATAANKMRKLNSEYCPKKSKRLGFDPEAVARLLKG